MTTKLDTNRYIRGKIVVSKEIQMIFQLEISIERQNLHKQLMASAIFEATNV